MLRNISFSFILVGFLFQIFNGEILLECLNQKDDTFLVDNDNCFSYIYCNGNNSEKGLCSKDVNPDLPYFSDALSCSASKSVCGNRPIIEETTNVNNATNATACPSTDDPNNPVFLPNNKSCSDYYLCYHGQPIALHCADMLHFDMKQQKCNTAEHVQCHMDDVSPREKCLPHTVDVYPYPDNCNYYYLCEMGYLMVMQCPYNEGWDYEKRACVLMPKAKCYNAEHRDENFL